MDLIYNVVWSTERPIKSNLCGKVVVAWSCRNLVAFSTGYRKLTPAGEGNNPSGTNEQSKRSQLTNAINILDPDSPWDVCSFSSGHEELIQTLTWDGTGSRLLSTDLVGVCKLWALKDHMVNDWDCVCTVDVGEGERLVAISWIDTGIKNLFTLSEDQQHSVMSKNLSDRFKTNRSKPPLVEIGGMRAKDGWVAISETGLICVTTIKPEVQITRKCLAQVRTRVAVADLAFSSKGKVIVVANDGELCSAVQFYRVSLSGGPDDCQILSDPLPCLFPHSHSELEDYAEYHVNNIQFLSKHSGEALLVCTTGPFGSCIKRWEMKKEVIQLHERFKQEIAHPRLQNYSVYEWRNINTYQDPAKILSLCLPRLPTPKVDFSPMGNLLTYPASILLVQYDDDRLQLLNSVGLIPSGSFRTKMYSSVDSEMAKKARTSTACYSPGCLGAICYSPCCCCVVGVTMTGDLRLFKLHHLGDSMGGIRLKRSLTDLLQYCLVTGWEWWDVLMAAHLRTPADTLDAISRQLTDEFSIQDVPQQQIRLSRFRAIKASLFRCMKDGAGQAVDCYVRQLLVAIAAFFRSLLKSSHTAAEQLNKISTTLDVEVDKVLQVLDTKELTLESTTSLSMFPLIQWLTDLAMFVVVVFTSHYNKESAPGVSLIRDTSTLGTLREMLVLIRLWGQTTPSVLPSITPSADKNEALALLFKIFTKIWLLSRQANADETDVHVEDRLAAEAAPLSPNPMFLQNMQIPNLSRGVSGKAVSGTIKPGLYQFGIPPAWRTAHQIFHPFASAIFPVPANGSHTMDVVRRIYFDKSPETKLKQCTRCNCVSLVDGISDHAASKAWEQRWVRACVCGGSWRKLPFKEQQNVVAAASTAAAAAATTVIPVASR
ncbi:mediator of RNA polymerase II transcription subunit 16-like isoform X2 [Oculina patagonica]